MPVCNNREANAINHERRTSPALLSRKLLEAGGIDAIAANDSPRMKMLSEADRLASLRETLAVRPAGDVWVFGYGSLVWNSVLHATEKRVARVDGWHRAFCLSITALRATIDKPGLMLALDRGGCCHGVAYRIADEAIQQELQLLWRREMVCGAYVPRWVDLHDEDGRRFGAAIAFTIDETNPQYAGDLDTHTAVQRLANATGGLGSCSDYLFRTCDGLRANGIYDVELEQLATRVRRAREGLYDYATK